MTDIEQKTIEMVLEELDTVCPYYSNDYEALHRAKKALRQVLEKSANSTTGVVESKALAQPEQDTQTYFDGIPETKYTAPPKREWVGLTDEEFEEAVEGLEDLRDCWIQIEAKLKEKNL